MEILTVWTSKEQMDDENYIMKHLIIFTRYKIA